jgi:alkylglycerol monooxygenase
MGVFERMVELVFTKGFEVYTYIWVYNNYALVDVRPDSLWLWIVTFLGVDLAYYWFHRMAHEINAFWASHITHHSSEEYNLTTALRQSASQALFSWVFYLPLALFVPPPLQFMHRQFNLLYQFWIHTVSITGHATLPNSPL